MVWCQALRTFRDMNDTKNLETSSHQVRPETNTKGLFALGNGQQIRPVKTSQQSGDCRVVDTSGTSHLPDASTVHRLSQSQSDLLGVRTDRVGRSAVRPAVHMIPRRASDVTAFRHPANVASLPPERRKTVASGGFIHHTDIEWSSGVVGMGNTSGGAASPDLHRFLFAAVTAPPGEIFSLAAEVCAQPMLLAARARIYRDVFAIPDWVPTLQPGVGIAWTSGRRSLVDIVALDGPAGGGSQEKQARRLLTEDARPEVVRLVSLADPSGSFVLTSKTSPLIVLFETGWWTTAKPLGPDALVRKLGERSF